MVWEFIIPYKTRCSEWPAPRLAVELIYFGFLCPQEKKEKKKEIAVVLIKIICFHSCPSPTSQLSRIPNFSTISIRAVMIILKCCVVILLVVLTFSDAARARRWGMHAHSQHYHPPQELEPREEEEQVGPVCIKCIRFLFICYLFDLKQSCYDKKLTPHKC